MQRHKVPKEPARPVLLSQGAARPGVYQGQYWGKLPRLPQGPSNMVTK